MISGMEGVLGVADTGSTDAVPDRHERLRDATEQMEGVFMQYLTKALRATVPGGGSPDAPGADMYATLLDEEMARAMAGDTRSGIAEALYRQLSVALGDDPAKGMAE